MATVAGAIANGGVLMAPHVVREIRDTDGRVIRRIGPAEWKRAVSPITAAAVTQLMIDAATDSKSPLPYAELIRSKMLTLLAKGLEDKDWAVLAEVARADSGLDSLL